MPVFTCLRSTCLSAYYIESKQNTAEKSPDIRVKSWIFFFKSKKVETFLSTQEPEKVNVVILTSENLKAKIKV